MAAMDEKNKAGPAGGAEGGTEAGGAGRSGQRNGLKDLSEEAVRELEQSETPHAGRGDAG